MNKKFLSWLPPPPPPLLPNDFPSFLSRVLNSPESDAQYTYDFLTIAIFIVLFGGNLVAVQVPLLRTIFPANNAYVAFQEEGFPFRFHDTLYFVNTSCCGVFFRLYCSFTLCAVLSNHSGSSVARKNFFLFCNGIPHHREALSPLFSRRFTFFSLSLSFFHAWTTLYSFFNVPVLLSHALYFVRGGRGYFLYGGSCWGRV